MKLHLPVRLFRAVMALMAAFPAFTQAVEIPSSYTTFFVTTTGEVTGKCDSAYDYAFLLQNDLTFSGLTVMNADADSRFFTSADPSGRSSLTFTNDCTLYVATEELLTFAGLDGLTFSSNEADDWSSSSNLNEKGYLGGAIFLRGTAALTISDNVEVLFSKNEAYSSSSSYGGAIYSYSGGITLSGNDSISFDRNYASSYSYYSSYYSYSHGGAIYSYSGGITLSGNDSISFDRNYASSSSSSSSYYSYSHGGAIYSYSGGITLSGNGTISFDGNYASSSSYYSSSYSSSISASYGGAIYSSSGGITLSGNDSISFDGNYASSSSYYSYSYGGAIYSSSGGITLSGNGTINFDGNYASSSSSSFSYSRGGAIYSYSGGITLSGNDSISFDGNYASSSDYISYGGAIYNTGATSIVENGIVEFSGNSVRYSGTVNHALGAAIFSGGSVSIRDNDSVIFENNYERLGSSSSYTYRLRGLYTKGDVNLSAASGKSIEFRDAMHAGGNLNLNAQYTNIGGETVAQTGDIIYTGEYAATHLGNLKSEYTETELKNSLTSDVSGTTTLNDGRLIVKEGAILGGAGLVVNASASGLSTPTVQLLNSKLNQVGAAISFAGGTKFEVSGQSVVSASNLTMGSGSQITLHATGANMDTAVMTCYGNFTLGESLTLNISFYDDEAGAGLYKLMTVTSLADAENWTADKISVYGVDGLELSFGALIWTDNTLYLNYDGEGGSAISPTLTEATWGNFAGTSEWDSTDANWSQGGYRYSYENGVDVVFGDTAAGGVVLVGELAPGSVLVDSAEDYTWNPATAGGKLTGDMTLTKKGSGTLTINTQNDYTGGTVLEGGKLVLGTQTALGTGGVDLRAGTLDLNNLAVQNNICATGGTLAGGSRYQGELTVDGDLSLDGTTGAAGGIQILGGSISGSPIVDTDISANGEGAKEIISDITGSSSLTVNGGDLLVSGKNNDYTGGTVINGGSLTTGSSSALGSGDVALNDGELDLNKLPVKNDITATGGTLSGAENYEGKLTVNGDLTLGGETTASGIELNGGSISGGSIVDTDILVDGEGNMEISSDITGNSSLTLNGGDLLISGENNDYTGGTTINGGSLTLDTGSSFGTGDITLNGGTLDTNGNDITNDIINNGGILITSYVLSEGRSLTVGKGGMKLMGYLTLAGGNLNFNGLPLTVEGTVEGQKAVNVFVSGYAVIDREGIVELANFGDDVSGVTAESFINTGYGTLSYDQTEHTLSITLTEKNVWMDGKGATWMMGTNAGWQDFRTFTTGNRVVFNTGGTVTITGGVEPASVLVDIEKSLTFSTKYDKKSGQFSGAIIGKGCVVKRGKGTLTMNDGNTYSGGTFIEAGTVKAKGAASFGTGDITMLGGTVNLASKVIGNDIIVDGTAAVKSGKKYTGEFTLKSGELMKGSVVNVAEKATLAGGMVNGTLSGVGSVAVTGSVELGTTGKITTNGLDISGSLTTSAKGLAMNSKSSVIAINGGVLSSAGKISAWGLSMIGGTLDVMNEKPMAITLKDSFTAKEGAVVSLYGGLTANALELDGSTFTLAADFTEKAKAQTINIKGKGVQNLISGSTVDVAGKMTVIGDLKVEDSSLSLHDVAEAAKPKAQGLSVKGDLNLTGGSTLSMTGALSAKNLTLGSGSSLTLGGSKMSTIKVGGALDLSGAVTLNLGFTVKEADVAKGKAFTLFTFKSFAGNLDNLTLGYEGAYTLDFNAKGTGITLVIADAAAWNEYATSVQETALTTQTAVTLKEEEESELPVATATRTVDPVLAGLADTLVQSTWGVAGASRAFADTISGRGAHSTLLEGGKGAAWVSVMGGSSRISSDGGHTGADFTLSGAAIGIEGNVTEKSTIGLAIGNSWGKVSPFSAYRVDQDSTHYGVYGNHVLRNNLTLSWMAAHTRTESDGNLAGMDCDWTQDALQLDARLTWARALNEKTTISAFGGLQYLATDSADFNGLSTGSVQNLRTEIGAGITHKVAPATQVYGELSFIGDVARNNPTATVGDYRTRGANPGRVGMNLHIGAAHQLNDSWSVNAGYSFELQKNATSHSLNAGASYKF